MADEGVGIHRVSERGRDRPNRRGERIESTDVDDQVTVAEPAHRRAEPRGDRRMTQGVERARNVGRRGFADEAKRDVPLIRVDPAQGRRGLAGNGAEHIDDRRRRPNGDEETSHHGTVTRARRPAPAEMGCTGPMRSPWNRSIVVATAVGIGIALWVAVDAISGESVDETIPADPPNPAPPDPEPTDPDPTGTQWTPPADDPTQPSPAAVAADREQWAVPEGSLDCGVWVRTSGWPTTFAPDPRGAECLLSATTTGTPAQWVVTERDFTGGMVGRIHRVETPDGLTVLDYEVAPDGTVTSRSQHCSAFRAGDAMATVVCDPIDGDG